MVPSVICFYKVLILLFRMQAVLKAHDIVISSMRPGVSWINMHK